MKGFSTIERRISANADHTKFRVQYKVNGKANARIVGTIAEAREVRDRTDLSNTPRPKMELTEITIPKQVSLGTRLAERKLEVVERCLSIMESL
jgi:hypothetical protein